MNKKEFAKLYYQLTNKDLGKYLGVSAVTVQSYAKRFKLEMKGKGNRTSSKRTKVNLDI